LNAPSNLQVTFPSDTKATLNWVDNSTFEIGFDIEMSSDGTNYTYIRTAGANNTTADVAFSYQAGIIYYFRVRAASANNKSQYSNIASGSLKPPVPSLISPADGLSGISLNPTLSWNASVTATSYILQVSLSNSFTSFIYNQSGLTNTSQQINSLNELTTYYWRVAAVNNSAASLFSNSRSFTTTTFTCGSPIGYAGKTYNTVLIGTQCWFKENLNVGAMIYGSQDQTNNNKVEKYCYNDDSTNCAAYGGLYQWAETVQYKNGATNSSSPNPAFSGNVQGICPTGWHIPTQAEFQTLASSAAVNNNSNALKAIGQGTGNGAGTNTSGFSALLAGYRDSHGYFYDLSNDTGFWSSAGNGSNSAYHMYLFTSDSNVGLNGTNKEDGFSVRCCKD